MLHSCRVTWRLAILFAAISCGALLLRISVARAQSTGKPSQQNSISLAPDAAAISAADLKAKLEQAQSLYRSEKFGEAVAVYQELIQQGSLAGVPFAGLARVYLKQKKVDEAYGAAQKAVELSPALADAHVALGEVDLRMGHMMAARNEFLAPLDAKAPTARAWFGLSRVQAATFEGKNASASLDKAYALDPQDPDIASAWAAQRPAAERLAALQHRLEFGDKSADREERSAMKHALAILQDQLAHPDRTCRMLTPVQSVTLKLEPSLRDGRDSRGAAVDVVINGYRARLRLDTRMDAGIALSGRVAEKMHLQQIARTEIEGQGVQNLPEAYSALAAAIKIGDMEFADCYVDVAENVSKDSGFNSFDGFVSAGMFRRFLIEINAPGGEVKLSALPAAPYAESASLQPSDPEAAAHDRMVPAEMAGWTRLLGIRDRLLVPAQLNGSPPKLLEVSLSAASDMLSIAAAKEVSSLGEKSSETVFDASGFLRDTFFTGPVTLEFAGHLFRRPRALALDFAPFSEALGIEVSGAVGYETLGAVDIRLDYRDGLVQLVP